MALGYGMRILPRKGCCDVMGVQRLQDEVASVEPGRYSTAVLFHSYLSQSPAKARIFQSPTSSPWFPKFGSWDFPLLNRFKSLSSSQKSNHDKVARQSFPSFQTSMWMLRQ